MREGEILGGKLNRAMQERMEWDGGSAKEIKTLNLRPKARDRPGTDLGAKVPGGQISRCQYLRLQKCCLVFARMEGANIMCFFIVYFVSFECQWWV